CTFDESLCVRRQLVLSPSLTATLQPNGILLSWNIKDINYISGAVILNSNVFTGEVIQEDVNEIFNNIINFFKNLLGIKMVGVKLNEIKEFKLYRGTSQDNMQFYKYLLPLDADCDNVQQQCSYLDTNVESGVTYYYRISIVGINNIEGRLSPPSKGVTYVTTITCTPAQIKSGTQCLVCNAQGTAYGADNSKCAQGQTCNAQGQCVSEVGAYGLTVTKQGTGQGTITSNPAGINCGTDCQESYNSGTQVTLTASASTNPQSTFVNWGGECTSTQNTCTLILNSDKTVTATFDLLLDTTAPTVTINSPTTQTSTSPISINVLTNKASTCKWSTTNTHTYSAMPNTLTAEAFLNKK
ncbi:MAG: hypothetical protein AAB907_03080, partial [Patescibacteria group bacterium]